jgi:hypothetical protein
MSAMIGSSIQRDAAINTIIRSIDHENYGDRQPLLDVGGSEELAAGIGFGDVLVVERRGLTLVDIEALAISLAHNAQRLEPEQIKRCIAFLDALKGAL